MEYNETVFGITKLEAREGFPRKKVLVTLAAELTLEEYEDLVRGKWNGHPVFIMLGQLPMRELTEHEQEPAKDSTQRSLDDALAGQAEGSGTEDVGEPQTATEIEQELAQMQADQANDEGLETVTDDPATPTEWPPQEDLDELAKARERAAAANQEPREQLESPPYGWDCHVRNVREQNLDLRGITATAKVAHLVYGQTALCGIDFMTRPKAAYIATLGEMNICQACEKTHRGQE